MVYAWDYWVNAGVLGVDYRVLMDAASRWVGTGQPYLPYQLAGPYVVGEHVGADTPMMYPPQMLLLFAPFLWLPAILWWAIPILITAWAIRRHRPRPLVWPVLALLVGISADAVVHRHRQPVAVVRGGARPRHRPRAMGRADPPQADAGAVRPHGDLASLVVGRARRPGGSCPWRSCPCSTTTPWSCGTPWPATTCSTA